MPLSRLCLYGIFVIYGILYGIFVIRAHSCFCDIHQCFIVTVIERGCYAIIRGSQCGNFYINKNVLIFFINEKLFYVIFKSCPSLLKSPESMTPGVLKYAYNTPALKPPQLITQALPPQLQRNCIVGSNSYFALLTPPHFFSFGPPPFLFKVKHLYLKLEVFHIYQNYDKDVISVCCLNYHIILSY